MNNIIKLILPVAIYTTFGTVCFEMSAMNQELKEQYRINLLNIIDARNFILSKPTYSESETRNFTEIDWNLNETIKKIILAGFDPVQLLPESDKSSLAMRCEAIKRTI